MNANQHRETYFAALERHIKLGLDAESAHRAAYTDVFLYITEHEADAYFSEWLEQQRLEVEENTPTEDVRAIINGLDNSMKDAEFDIGLAVEIMKTGRSVTNTLWGGSDGYPRLSIEEINGEKAILKTGCAGGTHRRYTPTDVELLKQTWKVVA